MPSNKNQHYVPRAHFKPFSSEGCGRSVNLYNIKTGPVQNAPVRGQCSKSYFYGKDSKLDDLLKKVEGVYATIVRRLESDATSINERDLENLLLFTIMQLARTEFAIERRKALTADMKNAVFIDHLSKEPEPSHEEIVNSTMLVFLKSREYLRDLRQCIVVNKTHMNFITSDDPAVIANRFHTQRLGTTTHGLGSSGTLLVLPLTPCHAFMCYDGGVYSVRNKSGHLVAVRRAGDIEAFNELQALNCCANLYFSEWSNRAAVRDTFLRVADRRVERHQLNVLIQTGADERGEHYRLATEKEKEGRGPFLLQSSANFPVPSTWPSLLAYRDPPRTYFNGSLIGHVRKQEWLEKHP